jgi:hypothetical protein
MSLSGKALKEPGSGRSVPVSKTGFNPYCAIQVLIACMHEILLPAPHIPVFRFYAFGEGV